MVCQDARGLNEEVNEREFRRFFLARSQILVAALAIVALIQNACADQGHMERALDALRSARSELNQASRDKGGHRTNAVQLIDQAIEQVKEGIRVGAKHGD
jgi:hypothetical protein